MSSGYEFDAVIIGSGPNGMAAAITMARQGMRVLVLEGRNTIGGGVRSAALTLPGFIHDVCAAIHPLAIISPFIKTLPLADHGLKFAFPPVSLAHPLDGQNALLLKPSLQETADGLGVDSRAYQRIIQPLLENWDRLSIDLLSELRIPRHPLLLARFASLALNSAETLAKSRFKGEPARALFAGLAGHSMLPLNQPASASFGLVLALSAHAVGWPVALGGSQEIIQAMAQYLRSLGGIIETNQWITKLDHLPRARAILLDVSPKQLLDIAGETLPHHYHQQLTRYRYGPGVFKVDWALDGPIPWLDEAVLQTATVHLGGTMAEIARSEREIWQGQHPEKPYLVLAQPSLFDSSRAPAGNHTAWAYCHVPAHSTFDMRPRIEAQVERFAPGFRQRILAYHTFNAAEVEAYNPNYVGGDINAGVQDLRQLFTRPVMRWDPYATPLRGVYLCSASTPPGGGVHGMCGYLAAKSALKREFHIHVG